MLIYALCIFFGATQSHRFQTNKKSTTANQTERNHSKPNSSTPNQIGNHTKPYNSQPLWPDQPKLAWYAQQNHIQLLISTWSSFHSCHFTKLWLLVSYWQRSPYLLSICSVALLFIKLTPDLPTVVWTAPVRPSVGAAVPAVSTANGWETGHLYYV